MSPSRHLIHKAWMPPSCSCYDVVAASTSLRADVETWRVQGGPEYGLLAGMSAICEAPGVEIPVTRTHPQCRGGLHDVDFGPPGSGPGQMGPSVLARIR